MKRWGNQLSFGKISEEFGPEAILPYSYAGNMGVLSYSGMAHRFFHRLGASQLDRTILRVRGRRGMLTVTGRNVERSQNNFGLQIHHCVGRKYSCHQRASVAVHCRSATQRRQLVVIDPYKTRTAKSADWYLPIHPGTDVALALAMMNVIINEKLYDADYVSNYTLGFEQLRQRAQEYPPERVAAWTGISADDIRKLAREYATVRPAVIRVNYGVQRHKWRLGDARHCHAALHYWFMGGSGEAGCNFRPAAPFI